MASMDRSFWMGVAAGAAAGTLVVGGTTAFLLSRGPHALTGKTREEKLLAHVFKHGRPGDAAHILKTIDEFCRTQHWLMNVGDVKGAIVAEEVRKASPRLVLEFGGYMGYSAILLGSLLPDGGRLISIEINPVYAALATKLVEFAGLSDKVTVLVSDVETALPKLEKVHGKGSVDMVFIDHWKDRYLPDMRTLENVGLLHPGSVVVADNVKYPGAPDFLKYMQESIAYKTVLHDTELEYMPWMKDIVTVSTVL